MNEPTSTNLKDSSLLPYSRLERGDWTTLFNRMQQVSFGEITVKLPNVDRVKTSECGKRAKTVGRIVPELCYEGAKLMPVA
jgi:hypothetical protein